MKTYVITILAAAVLILQCTENPAAPASFTAPGSSEEYDFCAAVLDAFFIFQEDLPTSLYAFGSVKDLYKSVKEPYTRYYDQDTAKMFLSAMTTSTVGLGIRIDSTGIGYLVTNVTPLSPASVAGLLEHDTIVAVNGFSLAGVSYDSLHVRLGGQKGDRRVLSIRRASGAIELTVTLDEFLGASVYADSLNSTTAYIAITQFSDETYLTGGTAVEFAAALTNTPWAKYTILDLRNNGGGGLEQCVSVCSEFVPIGTMLMNAKERYYDTQTRTAYTKEITWRAVDGGRARNRIVFVLTNEYTASASEVLVSVLMQQAADLTTVVGERTYGKGRGQGYWVTPDSGLAKVTYATLTPLQGPSYDMVGIPPDVAVPAEEALAAALDLIAAANGLAKQTAAARASAQRRISSIRHNRSAITPARWEPLCARAMKPWAK